MKNSPFKKGIFPQRADYAARGFWLFEMHGVTVDENGKAQCTCGKEHKNVKDIGKHPANTHGYKEAVPADQFIRNPKLNVAVALGEKSGCFVLDVDGADGINSWAMLPPLPETYTIKTGNGYHYYFKYTKPIKSNQGILGPGLEIKSNGASGHLPPSKHVNGHEYIVTNKSEIAEAPDWLFDRIEAHYAEKYKVKETTSLEPHESFTESDVIEMLDCISPDLGYYEWIAVGMGIHDGGFSLAVWDNWSANSKKYERGACATHWRSFVRDGGVSMATLVNMAKRGGWHPRETHYDRPKVDTSRVQGFFDKHTSSPVKSTSSKAPVTEAIHDEIPLELEISSEHVQNNFSIEPIAENFIKKPEKLYNKSTFDFDPLTLPGLIGDTVRWINRHALFPQPELALLNTLAFAGAVFGRRYASPIGTRTNIYLVGISGTGSGKDHSRKYINIMAEHAGLGKYIGSNSIRSESGLARSLEGNASQVMMIDEFGLFMQAIGDSRAAPHAKQISDLLMKLYSSSGGGLYKHGEYADARMKQITVYDPNLCIYGTTTEESYAASLKKSAIQSGNINRFIVARPREYYPEPNLEVPIMELDKELIGRWAQFEPKSLGEQVNTSNVSPKICKMSWGACDKIQRALLKEQADKRRDKFGDLWQRLYENTIKVAMIIAIARDRINPIFDPMDFYIAGSIVRNAINYMATLADEHMFDSETEMYHLELLRFIKTNGQVTRSDIINKMRKLRKRELDDLLVSMLDSGSIQAEKVDSGKGRPSVIYTTTS